MDAYGGGESTGRSTGQELIEFHDYTLLERLLHSYWPVGGVV